MYNSFRSTCCDRICKIRVLPDSKMGRRVKSGNRVLTIKQNMLWNSVGSLCNLGCQWLISVLIVRLSAGYDAAGIYSLAVSLYNIFGSIAQYRMYTYQVSDVNGENTVGEYLALRCITSTSALLLCTVYGVLTCSASAWASIILYAVYKTVTLVIDVFHACDQRHHRMDLIGISLMLQGSLSLAGFVFGMLLFSSLELAIVLMTIAVTIVGLAYDYPKTTKIESFRFGISAQKTKKLLIGCLPIVVAGIASSASVSVPRQILASCMGNAVLGGYASVAAPVAIIQMGASYVYNPLLGYFSERYFNKDYPGFWSLFRKSLAAIIGIGFACVVILSMFGERLLVLVFGNSILDYTYLLLPLVVFAILTGVQWFLNDLLISVRLFKMTFISALTSLIISLITASPLIELYGAMGVTFSGLCANAVSIGVMLFSLFGLLRESN